VRGLHERFVAPGPQPAELLARDGGAEDGVAHQVLRGGLGDHILFDTQVTQHFHGALVGDVCPGRVRQP
jgi:hypothetical protein